MKPRDLPYLPWIDQAETLYSYCVYVHRSNRQKSSAETARILFKFVHATRQHDIPSALNTLMRFVDPMLPDLQLCLRQHTIAGYFWPFTTPERKNAIVHAVRSGSSNFGLRVLGASTRSVAISHPLRWCPACFSHDLRNLGRPRWLTQHQNPTTFACMLHRAALLDDGGGGKSWAWPGERGSTHCTAFTMETELLAAVGQAASSFESINLPKLRATTVDRLIDLGVLHSRHAVRHERLQRWFQSTSVGQWLASAPNGLGQLSGGDWIAKMIWRRPNSHAVRWVALWSALDWRSPSEAGAAFLAAAQGRTALEWDTPVTPSAVAPRPNVPQGFADAAREGASYAEIGARLGATRSDVVRWFETYPTVRKEWRAKWLAHRRSGKSF